MIRRDAILLALVITLPGCAAPFVGGSAVVGAIPRPYASHCASDSDVAGVGLHGYAGTQLSSSWAIQARLQTITEATAIECELVPRTEPDGVHRFRRYSPDMLGEGLRSVDVQARLSLPTFRALSVSAGFGFETDRSRPFLVGGIGAHIGRSVKFTFGAEAMALHTPYAVVDETWQNDQIISSTRVGGGHEWKRSWLFRLGVEIPIISSAAK